MFNGKTEQSVVRTSKLELAGIDAILLKSSSENSTKQFRITVDDTGTLSATEVTDA